MKRSVKSIRQQYKAMKTEADLPEGCHIQIVGSEDITRIGISDAQGNLSTDNKGHVLGYIYITKSEEDEFWYASKIEAEHGYGPLLFDLAIEFCTSHGSGLTGDPHGSLSEEGYALLERYHKNRPDVERTLLPEQHHRTSYIDDDLGRLGNQSPNNFLYSKQPERSQRLQSNGILKII